MFRPKGIYPALMTPFGDDFLINETELQRLRRIRPGAWSGRHLSSKLGGRRCPYELR